MNPFSNAVKKPCCPCPHMEKPVNYLHIDQRKMLGLAAPIFVEILLRTLLGNIDQLMLSRYSSNAVASVSNANQVISLLNLVLQVACIAATIIIVQLIGAKNEEKLPKIYAVTLAVNMLFSVALTGTLLFQDSIFSLLRLAPELVPGAKAYFTIVVSGIAVQGLTMSFSAILRSNARVKEIMAVSVTANVVNVIGNACLINGIGPVPAMGAAGAAVSTLLSQCVSLFLMFLVYRKRIHIPLSFRFTLADLKLALSLLRLGLPAAVDSFSYSATQVVIVSFINSYGVVPTTARAYVNIVAAFTYMCSMAVGQATQITAGNLIGAREIPRTKRLVSRSMLISASVAFTLAVLLHLFSAPVFSIFTTDPEILALIKTVTFIDIFLEVGRALNMVVIDSLLAAGDVLPTVICGIGSVWLIAVPVGYLLGTVFGLGIAGVWIGMAIDECFRGFALFLRWKSNRWQNKKVLAAGNEN